MELNTTTSVGNNREIDLKSLDNMILSHMAVEGLTEEFNWLETHMANRRKCSIVYKLLMSGELDNACKILEEFDSELLHDKRIDFQIKKQKFVEILNSKHIINKEKEALEWIRQQLAPLAHEAYPNAYDEFKKVLLYLIYEEKKADHVTGPNFGEDSHEYLAGLVYSNLRYRLGIKDSYLVHLFKYLIHIHYRFKTEVTTSTNIDILLEKLKCEDRYPSPLEVNIERISSLSDKDIQALMQAINISHDEAIQALNRSKGDVSSAFESELETFKINMKELNNLVLEYAAYRNLLQLSESDSEDGDIKETFSEADVNEISHMQDFDEINVIDHIDFKKCASESDKLELPVKTLKKISYKCDSHLKMILKVIKMVKDGKYIKAIEKTNQIDPALFTKHPHILFELWKFEVLRVSSNGNHDNALDLLRKNLTPIVKHNNELFSDLKETLSMIMKSKNDQPSVTLLCFTLQEALQESLKLPGPSLISVTKTLLESHQSWFSKQKHQDIFTKKLGIDILLSGTHDKSLFNPTQSLDENSENQITNNEENNSELTPTLVYGEGDVPGDLPNELAVQQIMDILNLPRNHAVDLLTQYDGSVENVFMNIIN